MHRLRAAALAFLVPLLAALASSVASAGEDAAVVTPPRPAEVLVFGGTGQLGAEIVRRLVARGERVTVFTRAGSDRARLAGLPVTFVTGDLMKPAEIDAAFAGRRVDAVITAVRVEDGDARFYAKLMPPLTAAARAAGVRHMIHSGAVGAGANVERFAGLGWDKVPGLLDRLKDQGVGEDVLRASGLTFTIIRNTRLWPDGTPATGKAALTEDQGFIGPMTRADLAALTVYCLGNAGCYGKTYHVRDESLAWPPPR
ncbi:MAG: NAD(P)H-binding protein [Gammaproteobacteria bacterium]|nr:NAD(P)H-binding protein [Gammaproteobacteria bacterium]